MCYFDIDALQWISPYNVGADAVFWGLNNKGRGNWRSSCVTTMNVGTFLGRYRIWPTDTLKTVHRVAGAWVFDFRPFTHSHIKSLYNAAHEFPAQGFAVDSPRRYMVQRCGKRRQIGSGKTRPECDGASPLSRRECRGEQAVLAMLLAEKRQGSRAEGCHQVSRSPRVPEQKWPRLEALKDPC
jgi:hypothetical protein